MLQALGSSAAIGSLRVLNLRRAIHEIRAQRLLCAISFGGFTLAFFWLGWGFLARTTET